MPRKVADVFVVMEGQVSDGIFKNNNTITVRSLVSEVSYSMTIMITWLAIRGATGRNFTFKKKNILSQALLMTQGLDSNRGTTRKTKGAGLLREFT